ncbi:MAG: NAD(P)-dependent oxidoreductase [Limisphaerales bacterium]
MKILFTGASSFTGFWFVKSLAAAGHEIICPVTKDLQSYTGTRGQRMELLEPSCRFIPQAPFGSDNFLKLVGTESFDLLCHHAADVTNYKSMDFDAQAAVRNNTYNLPNALAILRERGLKSVVLTGTYFEAGEGMGSEPLRNFSPYSLSKTLTFDLFLAECHNAGLPLGKFVIPNPFGPLEEPRFTAHLMRNWQTGKVAEVKTPDYVRDNIHVDLLAVAYAKFVAHVITSKARLLKINPSGYIEKQGEFAQRIALEVKSRLGWVCELNCQNRKISTNHSTAPILNPPPNWCRNGANQKLGMLS